MQLKGLEDFIAYIQTDSELRIEISFCRKKPAVNYKPQISFAVKKEITSMLTGFVVKEIEKNTIVDYQAVGVLDGQIECIELKEVTGESEGKNLLVQSLEPQTLDISKIDYYVVEIKNNEKCLRLYRQFQKLRKLRKGILLQAIDHELKKLESDFIGLDDTVDILEWENELIVFNHISLERIFGYRDVFVQKTKEAIEQLRDKNIMENIEQFENDCLQDSRIQKRFTNMIVKERLPLFFEHIGKAQEVVEKLGLGLQFNESGQLIYEKKEQLFIITSLMSDAYFESLLAGRVGVVELEGNIEG